MEKGLGRVFFLGAGFLLLVWAGGGCRAVAPVEVNVLRNYNPEDYKSAALSVSSDEAEAFHDMARLEDLLMNALRAKNLFEYLFLGWSAPNAPKDLSIRVNVLESKHVGKVRKVVLGKFAGKSHLVVEVELLDSQSGARIGRYEVEGHSAGETFSDAGTNNQAIDEIVKSIADYVEMKLR